MSSESVPPITQRAIHGRVRLRAEHTEATRRALVDAGRALFAERGYAGSPTEEIVRRAGVTRGALYHHFRGKEDLFRAVLEEVEQGLTERVAREALSDPDPARQLELGLDLLLDACREPEIQRIALVDAPSVLGWAGFREVEARYGLGLIKLALGQAMDSGYLERQPVEPLAHLLGAALIEAGMVIAHAEDPEAAREEMARAFRRLLAGLRPRP